MNFKFVRPYIGNKPKFKAIKIGSNANKKIEYTVLKKILIFENRILIITYEF